MIFCLCVCVHAYVPLGAKIGTEYCPGSGRDLSCPAGTFNADIGQSSSSVCTPCAAGKYSNVRASTCLLCQPGSYCPGNSSAIPCPQGTYGDSTGLTSATCSGPCAVGFFCPPGSNSSTMLPCPGFRSCALVHAICGTVYDDCNQRTVSCGPSICYEPAPVSWTVVTESPLGLNASASALPFWGFVVATIQFNQSINVSNVLQSGLSLVGEVHAISSQSRVFGVSYCPFASCDQPPFSFTDLQPSDIFRGSYNPNRPVEYASSTLPLPFQSLSTSTFVNNPMGVGYPARFELINATTIRIRLDAKLLRLDVAYIFRMASGVICSAQQLYWCAQEQDVFPLGFSGTNTFSSMLTLELKFSLFLCVCVCVCVCVRVLIFDDAQMNVSCVSY
jgi:hypothetical protein